MPIPFLSRESPNLAIVDWCLIASQEVSIREIARFGDSLDKKGIGITPDPFGAGAYNL